MKQRDNPDVNFLKSLEEIEARLNKLLKEANKIFQKDLEDEVLKDKISELQELLRYAIFRLRVEVSMLNLEMEEQRFFTVPPLISLFEIRKEKEPELINC